MRALLWVIEREFSDIESQRQLSVIAYIYICRLLICVSILVWYLAYCLSQRISIKRPVNVFYDIYRPLIYRVVRFWREARMIKVRVG